MTRFLLIRHGETAWHLTNAKGATGWGAELAPLTETGIRQIQGITQAVREWSPEIILSSPTSRTLHTCALLSTALGIPFEVAFDLHEWIPDFQFKWKTSDDILVSRKEMEQLGGEWPEGETRCWEPLSQVRQRVSSVLKRYSNRARVAVTCHEIVISALTGRNIGLAERIEYNTSDET